MKKNKILYSVWLIVISAIIALTSCTEEIDFKTESFESALVIEATITNEFKFQEVVLSRTFAFEEDGPNPETNATVSIVSNAGEFVFNEIGDGKYVSINKFKAQENLNYTLRIVTNNGREYSSTSTQLTQSTQIDQLYAVRETDDLSVNGMAIYIDSFDPTNNSKFYRYEYEETYKIIAPMWVNKEILVLDNFTCEVDLVFKDPTLETQTCYNTVKSIKINQTNTNALNEDRITRHLIRFIESENFILSHRYSILVKQFVQSPQAYRYYETLNNFSEEGSIFSQIQPGFFNGNVFSVSNPIEKVIGFFDVSTVTSERIFFNYTDFYPDENIPPFPINCIPTNHNQFTISGYCGSLITGLISDRIVYHSGASKIIDYKTGDSIVIGPFLMLLKPCGDCTAYGNNLVPEFWEE